ncbi:MAG TPA: transcriptional regulator NrdR [Chthoniobacterales bacterium]
MRCPKCGAQEDRVIDSRASKEGESIRRRRECLTCHFRFTTYEVIERAEFRVVKRDGRTEPFDRAKLLGGVLKACEKRPVSTSTLEKMVDEIIAEVHDGYEREIPTSILGAKVMEKLHSIDGVAYVRFASIYRQFTDIGEFIEEIQTYQNKTKVNATQAELFQKL